MSEEKFQAKYGSGYVANQQQIYQPPFQQPHGNQQGQSVFCSSCGAKVEPGTKFCPNCGNQIK